MLRRTKFVGALRVRGRVRRGSLQWAESCGRRETEEEGRLPLLTTCPGFDVGSSIAARNCWRGSDKTKGRAGRPFRWVVEAAGIEPASANDPDPVLHA